MCSNPGPRIVRRFTYAPYITTVHVATSPILPLASPPACNESYAAILAGLVEAALANQEGVDYVKVDPVKLDSHGGSVCYAEQLDWAAAARVRLVGVQLCSAAVGAPQHPYSLPICLLHMFLQ